MRSFGDTAKHPRIRKPARPANLSEPVKRLSPPRRESAAAVNCDHVIACRSALADPRPKSLPKPFSLRVLCKHDLHASFAFFFSGSPQQVDRASRARDMTSRSRGDSAPPTRGSRGSLLTFTPSLSARRIRPSLARMGSDSPLPHGPRDGFRRGCFDLLGHG